MTTITQLVNLEAGLENSELDTFEAVTTNSISLDDNGQCIDGFMNISLTNTETDKAFNVGFIEYRIYNMAKILKDGIYPQELITLADELSSDEGILMTNFIKYLQSHYGEIYTTLKNVATIGAMSVEEDYRGSGIGSGAINELRDVFNSLNIDLVVTHALNMEEDEEDEDYEFYCSQSRRFLASNDFENVFKDEGTLFVAIP